MILTIKYFWFVATAYNRKRRKLEKGFNESKTFQWIVM